MGHLSNPIGFRLTFEKKWNFNFFVKNIYYPEVINVLINLRDYIYYYLTRKKILQSGLCLSHFMLSKYLKKYFIKIYIYHIDLEKTAYDLINKFYHLYYETYNEISHKYDKNKTAQQVQLYHFLRDISNSDVFIYLLIYILFYKGFKNKNTQNSLNDNIYMKNKKVQSYYKLIIYSFFKQLLYIFLKTKYKSKKIYKFQYKDIFKIKSLTKKVNIWLNKLKNINKLNYIWSTKKLALLEKNKKIAKIKGLILYKAKKLINKKPLTYHMVENCNYLKKRVLNSIQYNIIKLAWQITKISIKNKINKVKQYKNNINIIQENELLQKALQKFKFKKFCWVGKYKYYRGLTLKKIKKKILTLNQILYDKIWIPNEKYVIMNNFITRRNKLDLNKYDIKIDIFSLFFFLAKKTGFKKVKNTLTLWKKWSTILKYIQLFNIYDFLYKEKFFYNLNFFYFYIKIAIWYSAKMKKKTKKKYFNRNFFNLKKLIFSCLQQGVYITFFRKSLIWLNIFLKMGLLIIHNSSGLNKLGFNNIILYYSFINNNNVTAIFLAHYIVLKLKKGFSVVKTLNPLKRELVRVSKKSRGTPYSDYLTNYAKKRIILKYKYKKIISCFMESCYTLYDYLSSFFYVNNNIKIRPNLFLYFFYFKDKIKKIELNFSFIWRYNILLLFKYIIYYHIKFILFKIKQSKWKNKKIKNIIKKYIKTCRLKTKCFIFKFHLQEFMQIRHNIWLFFLSIFRFYEKKKKKYNYYYKDLKIQILKHYQKYEKNNNILCIMKQLPKKNILNFKDVLNVYNINFFSMLNLANNNKLILYKSKKKFNILKITFSSFFNRHYVHYSKLKTLWNIFNKINLRNEKDLYIPKYKSLIMGFKMVLKGRFSRKQRASKVTLIKGKVPLNTFNMKVDYAYESITLKNSAISLKFYLYKEPGLEIYKRHLTI